MQNIKVFIENEAGSKQKNLYNEKTLDFRESITVARKYPFPYGFILGTTGEDGDNLDVFVLTDKPLKTGQIVECVPVGLMEQFEKSWDKSKRELEEVDHNILAVLEGDEPIKIKEGTKEKLVEFVSHVFDNIRENKTRIGRFLGKKNAIEHILSHLDSNANSKT